MNNLSGGVFGRLTVMRSCGKDKKQNMCNRKRCVVFKNGVTVGEYDTLKRAAKAVGANYSKASEVANGKRKTTNGYNFKYIEEFPIAVTKYHFGEE